MTQSKHNQDPIDSSDSEDDLAALLEASSQAFAIQSQQRKLNSRKMFEEGDDLIQFDQQDTTSNPSIPTPSKWKGKGKELPSSDQ